MFVPLPGEVVAPYLLFLLQQVRGRARADVDGWSFPVASLRYPKAVALRAGNGGVARIPWITQ